MCGIAGWAKTEPSPNAREQLAAMLRSLEHRGPDDEGMAIGGSARGEEAAMGIRRLSIIDITGGHQPIVNEDGKISLVCNGEIYNCLELRRELEAAGHTFRSRSDAEVIVHLYEDYGVEAIPRLRGMFALALFDGESLVLARDRLGIKPLYLRRLSASGVAFASEAKALAVMGRMQVDEGKISTYLARGYMPSPYSPFNGIEKLPAGHVAIWSAGALKIRRWWSLSFEIEDVANVEEGAMTVLDSAVESHLMSDVPVGVFLSGGLDSSVITALMTRHATEPVKSFTIGFAGEQGGLDERKQALEVARSVGTVHSEIVLDTAPIDVIGEVVHAYDEPVGDEAALPTWMMASAASDHVKVVLTGEGGDEVFGGYRKYQVILAARRLAGTPGSTWRRSIRAIASLAGKHRAEKLCAILDSTPADASLHFDEVFLASEWSEILDEDLAVTPEKPLSITRGDDLGELAEMLAVDMAGYLADGLLHKVDRMSMAHGLEARVPYLDHLVVEFIARLPQSFKVRLGTGKRLLRSIASEILPRSIASRPKHGFTAPLNRWLRRDLSVLVEDLLSPARIRMQGYWDAAAIEELVLKHRAGDDTLGKRVWLLLAWQLWYTEYIERQRVIP